jgi:hypothetical protein
MKPVDPVSISPPEHLLKPLDQSLALQARQPLDPEQAVDASVLLGTLF